MSNLVSHDADLDYVKGLSDKLPSLGGVEAVTRQAEVSIIHIITDLVIMHGPLNVGRMLDVIVSDVSTTNLDKWSAIHDIFVDFEEIRVL